MEKIAILVGGEKGGTGKSTVAVNLAIMLRIAGYDALLVDCDKQQTSLKFAGRRAGRRVAPSLVCTHLAGSRLQIPLIDLYSKYDALVIDCGGQDSVELRSAMITPCVSQMIIPVKPGYFDLETLVNMDTLVDTSRGYNPNLAARCLINMAPTNPQVTTAQEARDFISSDLANLGLFDTVIHERTSFSYASANGEGVVEYDQRRRRDDKGSQEMIAFYTELLGVEFPLAKVKEFEQMLVEEGADE